MRRWALRAVIVGVVRVAPGFAAAGCAAGGGGWRRGATNQRPDLAQIELVSVIARAQHRPIEIDGGELRHQPVPAIGDAEFLDRQIGIGGFAQPDLRDRAAQIQSLDRNRRIHAALRQPGLDQPGRKRAARHRPDDCGKHDPAQKDDTDNPQQASCAAGVRPVGGVARRDGSAVSSGQVISSRYRRGRQAANVAISTGECVYNAAINAAL